VEFKPGKTEMEKVAALPPFDRYQYTIKKVADFGQAYTLVHEDGTRALADADGKTLLSVWPAASYAKRNAIGEWLHCQAQNISLEQLISVEPDEVLVNVFSVNGKAGFIVSPEELKRDLKEELEQY
jgi:hypothetical protein